MNEGINDLNTLKPDLASEWSEENEIKPTEVSIGSHKKVIWKCKLGHEWIVSHVWKCIFRKSRCFEFGSENVLLIINEIKLHRIGAVSVCHCATSFLNLGTKKTAVKCSIFTTVCFVFYLILGVTTHSKL